MGCPHHQISLHVSHLSSHFPSHLTICPIGETQIDRAAEVERVQMVDRDVTLYYGTVAAATPSNKIFLYVL